MVTLEQAAQTLGMTPRQLRRPIEATEPLLAPLMGRGEKNRVLLDYGAVEALRAVEDRRAKGATMQEAVAAVADEMGGQSWERTGATRGANSHGSL